MTVDLLFLSTVCLVFDSGFITNHQSDQTCVMSQYVEKRRSTAALHNASELAFRMTATFWSAAVFCRSWIIDPQSKLEYGSFDVEDLALQKQGIRPTIYSG